MKIATDIKQSQQLARILPIESADMFYGTIAPYDYSDRMYDGGIEDIPLPKTAKKSSIIGADEYDGEIPAWSLSALMAALPNKIEHDFKTYFFKLQTDVYSSGEKYYDLGYQGSGYWLEYEDSTELIDACYNLIIKLHERELL